jgi:CRISPR-associated protein Cas5 subtype I-B
MRAIRFEIEGVLNSFRVPFFKNYHKSFLAPPKTTIIGMLCNISLKSQKEFYEILNNDLIEVSVVIEEIKGKAKDLWSYKIFEKKNRGKSIVRRDKLFIPKYSIYLKIADEKLFDEIFENLKSPKNIPSLGLDDEIVIIKNIEVIELVENDSKRVDSVFLNDTKEYKVFIKDTSKAVELPTSYLTPIKFEAFKNNKRVPKTKVKELFQVEAINCEIEIECESFLDKKYNKRIVFY